MLMWRHCNVWEPNFVNKQVPGYDLNQCWLIVNWIFRNRLQWNWTFRNRLQWIFNQNTVSGLTQERRNSIANALELRLSCTNPSMCWSVMVGLGYYFIWNRPQALIWNKWLLVHKWVLRLHWVNSFRSQDTYMCHWTGSALLQLMSGS